MSPPMKKDGGARATRCGRAAVSSACVFTRLGAGIIIVAVAAGGLPACDKGGKAETRATARPQQTGELAQVVAKVDDTVITLGDVQDGINKQAPFVRARYSTPEKKKEFLDNLIRIEVMAKEAEKRGYDKDPEVLRVMKQQMIAKFLRKDFESKLKVEDVPDADVEKYYKENPAEFNRPDQVRVSQIVVKDKAKADKVAREAGALSKTDPKPFRDLVTKYSEDDDSKARGGDLTSFDRATTAVPKPIVEAAFALKEVGDISPPVKVDQGYAVLRLTQKQAGFSRPLAEVKRQIQQRLFRDLRTKSMDAFVADLRTKYTVTVDEANLAKVTVDTGMSTSGPGPAGPGATLGAPGMAPGSLPAVLHGAAPGAGPAIPSTPPVRLTTPAAGATAPAPTPAPPAGGAPKTP